MLDAGCSTLDLPAIPNSQLDGGAENPKSEIRNPKSFQRMIDGD